ncbi:MAG: adenylate cyclase [Cyanobacteria bacterium RYN_339]|nr:adenylate cyclase [Cyanobacteria bacterium RYN_339]
MRVLIVDDDPDCRLILQLMLAKLDWDLHFAENGVDGLAAAKVLQPDLILMDLLMPQMTGLEAVAAMRATPALAGTAVFAITAMAFEQERHMAFAAGFDVVITKPFSRRHLVEAIQRQFPGLELAPWKVPA